MKLINHEPDTSHKIMKQEIEAALAEALAKEAAEYPGWKPHHSSTIGQTLWIKKDDYTKRWVGDWWHIGNSFFAFFLGFNFDMTALSLP